jgi:hypothetical protein
VDVPEHILVLRALVRDHVADAACADDQDILLHFHTSFAFASD